MSKLNKIDINGFKSIRHLELVLGDLNVLIGANGSGKSNFISLFKLLNQMVNKNFQVFVGQSGGADTLLSFGRKMTDEINIKLSFGANGYKARLIPGASDALIFAEELCSYTYPTGYTFAFEINSGGKESNLIEEARSHPNQIAHHVLQALKSWRIYHFHDTSDSAKVKQAGDINDNRELRPDASNLAAFLFGLKQTQIQHYLKIVNTIRLVAPFFDDFVLQPMTVNPKRIQLEWKERGSDSYFNAYALSDGTLRFICLSTLLLQPILPSTILVDEPELGLHPYAITLLASLLKSASTKTQVIVSTQSVSLVNQFSVEDVIVVDKTNDGSSFKRLLRGDVEQWMEEYSLGEVWEKNIIGGRPQ